MNKITAIILAAGKGKRMKSKSRQKQSGSINKVVLPLGDKPMILRTADLLKSVKISNVIVVVGFAKKSVVDAMGNRAVFVEQKKRLGTAHAASCALKVLDHKINDVLVLNGDDSALYTKEIILRLIKRHVEKNASVTFLTIELSNPSGLGRVIRNNAHEIVAIIEDKDAIGDYREIKEVNPACYVFAVSFLKKYIKKVERSKITGEYYLTRLIDIAIKNNEKIEIVRGGKLHWRGINTIEELKEAERLFISIRN